MDCGYYFNVKKIDADNRRVVNAQSVGLYGDQPHPQNLRYWLIAIAKAQLLM